MTTEPRTRRIVTVMDLYTCDDDSMKTHILSEAWTHTVLWKCSLLTDTHTHTKAAAVLLQCVCVRRYKDAAAHAQSINTVGRTKRG